MRQQGCCQTKYAGGEVGIRWLRQGHASSEKTSQSFPLLHSSPEVIRLVVLMSVRFPLSLTPADQSLHCAKWRRVRIGLTAPRAASAAEGNRLKRAAASLELKLAYGDATAAPGMSVKAKGFKSDVDGKHGCWPRWSTPWTPAVSAPA